MIGNGHVTDFSAPALDQDHGQGFGLRGGKAGLDFPVHRGIQLFEEVAPGALDFQGTHPGAGEDVAAGPDRNGGLGKTVPARRVVESLGIKTLEELEGAAHDGRLEQVEGFGERRVEMVKTLLAGMLNRFARRRAREVISGAMESPERPPVRLLLEIDREYREKSAEGKLRKISPKRFNPKGESWLPVMSTRREGWDFTVLYSNTPRAHQLRKFHDWVVIYYDLDGSEDQVTVVTDIVGDLGKKRVVRGRERESLRYYSSRES